MGTVGQEAFRIAKFKEWMRDVAKKFEDKLAIENGNLFFVDATNKDDPHLGKLVQTAIRLLRRRINVVSKVPAICESVAKALGGSGGQQLEPVISMTDFQSLCRSLAEGSTTDDGDQAKALRQLFEGDGNRASKVIAAYLRDAGEVLYIEDLPFLVRNPRWFAHGIFGFLIDIFTPYYSSDGHQDFGLSEASGETSELPRADDLLRDINGLVDKAFLAELLEHAIEIVELNPDGTSTDQLIMLMEKLDLCYQTDEKYLIPALLQDEDGKAERGECKREWDLDLPSLTSKRIFVSRRLQCSDHLRTFITPGFFPRLQVVLQKEVHEWNVQEQTNCGKRLCDLEKYFCRLRCNNGTEVLVEHSGSYDYFLDIMVKSYESREDTEEFLHKIINRIRRFCASIKGCQGVTLVEGIIRPDCVGENIALCRHRQSILATDLKERMNSAPNYKCYWEKVEDENGTMLLPAAMHDPQRLLDGVPQEACECYPDWNVKVGKKRGLAVIISTEKYKSGGRPGGSEDRENLKALAQSLHFDFKDHVMVDYTVADVIRALKTIAQEKVLEEHKSFVCFVNGHGASIGDGSEDHYLRDQDDEKLFLDSIVRPFQKCKHLQDKPKVFLVNSCRGSNMLLADGEDQCGTSEQQQPASQQLPKEAREYEYVRKVQDCLIVFSTSGRCVSARDPTNGTVFVCALTNAFRDNRERLDVQGIVCRATYEVAAKQHEWKKKGGDVKVFGQCPVHVSSLTKLLYWR